MKRENEDDMKLVKSRSDRREYRRIILGNSLEVLLISDPNTDKCAASMDVGVGSFSDPDGLEGLAHFLEHMLFYASEKYPVEDSYSKFIVEHGGSTNAFTAPQHTNFYFDVNSDSFEEALDRFAQFFIRPLMPADATTREIKAVDSENQKNLLSDSWRMNQLQKHFSDKAHPYYKFCTGNWDTLEVRPKAKGLDTRLQLIEFYKENYSANIMHLAIYSGEALDKIQSLVLEKFQDVPNFDKTHCPISGEPCKSEHLQVLVRSVPIKEGHTLRVEWPITPNICHYKEAPCMYLGHLIGHEGEGSLFHFLKKLGWATSLCAGEGDWTKEYSFFSVTIDLTDAGHEHMQEIVGLLFKYIQMILKSGECNWIFDELAAVCDTSFHYQDKNRPSDYVVKLASNMRVYPPRDWLCGSSLPSNYNPDIIKKILDQLSFETFRIFWHSKKFEGQTDAAEPWYGTPYKVEKLSSSLIQEWMSVAPNENLHLPVPNVFIPSDFSLKQPSEKAELPVLLRSTSFASLWYKSDNMFQVPKAFAKIDFSCPNACNSPETVVLTDIFSRLVMDSLNEYAYYAQVAGLSYSVNNSDRGFEITLLGYNHKLRILLEKVVDRIAQFSVKNDRFSVIKDMLKKDYENFKFQQPYQQANYYCSLILENQLFHWKDEYEALSYLQPEDLSKFIPIILSRTFLVCYIGGNIEPKEAESMVEYLEDTLFKNPTPICHPLFPSQHLTKRIVKLGRGIHFFYQNTVLNSNDENSALLHYIQVHQDDFLMNVKLQLFALIAKQPAFHQLRSVEQLGYITVLMQRNDSGIRGIQFIVQSSVKGPGGIDVRIDEFLKNFEKKLYSMTADDFKNNVDALIEMKREKHKNLSEESNFYWLEVSNGTLKFDRREREVEALQKLSQQELIDFFNEYIRIGSPNKRRLSIRLYGNLHSHDFCSDTTNQLLPDSRQITDIFSFRSSQPLFGSLIGRRGHVKL